MDKNYITKNGFQSLRSELEELKLVERPKVVETVSWAAGNGDRSENGDYLYGKKRLREIDRRIRFLIKRIEASEVVEPHLTKSDKVLFGAHVLVEHEDGTQKEYQIVGEDEAVAEEFRISWKSPLAKALLGKARGDEVIISKPKGEEYVNIVSLSYR